MKIQNRTRRKNRTRTQPNNVEFMETKNMKLCIVVIFRNVLRAAKLLRKATEEEEEAEKRKKHPIKATAANTIKDKLWQTNKKHKQHKRKNNCTNLQKQSQTQTQKHTHTLNKCIS